MGKLATAIIQIIWIPIGLTGVICGLVSDCIETSHLKICDFVEVVKKI
tara:strand:- start:1314 stop:1457 length:144 start_codon:yes stop_codon:yes gene_type:complete